MKKLMNLRVVEVQQVFSGEEVETVEDEEEFEGIEILDYSYNEEHKHLVRFILC